MRERREITDWKSGGMEAGKSFAFGIGGGMVDFLTEPYKCARKDGFLGILKGIGKGSTSLIVKSSAGKSFLFDMSDVWSIMLISS